MASMVSFSKGNNVNHDYPLGPVSILLVEYCLSHPCITASSVVFEGEGRGTCPRTSLRVPHEVEGKLWFVVNKF